MCCGIGSNRSVLFAWMHDSKIAQGHVAHLEALAKWIGFDQVRMKRFELLEFERRPLALRQSNDIDITCQFLKGTQGDRARDVDPIEVSSQWFKGTKICINEWLNRDGNKCFHEKESLSFFTKSILPDLCCADKVFYRNRSNESDSHALWPFRYRRLFYWVLTLSISERERSTEQ